MFNCYPIVILCWDIPDLFSFLLSTRTKLFVYFVLFTNLAVLVLCHFLSNFGSRKRIDMAGVKDSQLPQPGIA
jgi:hypothetical protein